MLPSHGARDQPGQLVEDQGPAVEHLFSSTTGQT
jgi:hypothetical protein